MTTQQALLILEQASAQAPLPKAAHIQIEQALRVLKEALALVNLQAHTQG